MLKNLVYFLNRTCHYIFVDNRPRKVCDLSFLYGLFLAAMGYGLFMPFWVCLGWVVLFFLLALWSWGLLPSI